MGIKTVCENYFKGFSTIKNEKASKKEKTLAKIYIASYFLVLPAVIMGIGLTLSSCCSGPKKPAIKVENKNPIQTKIENKVVPILQDLPQVTNQQGFFVEVLNKRGYKINGKNVNLPPAGYPEKFVKNEYSLHLLRGNKAIGHAVPAFHFKDLSTEQAIQESKAFPIALNFANENHMGGGPGFHKDPETNLFVYDAPSARAQEESMCQRSDLMASLTQLPHTLKADVGSNFFRSYYDDKFDSQNMAYVSLNHLFAVQGPNGFYDSQYLEEPKRVAFVTSAAQCYIGKDKPDCSKNSETYLDAKERIETHLLAAAAKACAIKTENREQPVELILGAFGCGAFAPSKNPDEYREMIASIYKELLPEFNGFFDLVTFAVPTFGDNNRSNPAVANHRIFKNVLEI